MELKDKIVLVVGAGGLIGSEFSKTLLDNGAICFFIDKDASKLKNLKKKLSDKSLNKIYFEQIDILNESQIKRLKNKIKKKFKKIDKIVNLVANDPKVTSKKKFSSFEKINLKEFQKDLNIGITGMILIVKYFIELLKLSKEASVVNMASDLSIISPDHRIYSKKSKNFNSKPISYSIIKHGVVGMTKYLATYYGLENIRFNSISPGGISHKQSLSFQKKISKLIPMNRMAKIGEINSTLIYLLSNKSSYTTGVNLVVDGGRSLW